MNNRFRFLIPFVSLLAAGSTVAADEADKSAVPPAQSTPWLSKADKDGDGRLSREEFWNPDGFAKVDADGDGFATLKELQAWFAKNPRPAQGQRQAVKPAIANSAAAEPVDAAPTPDDVEQRAVTIWSHGVKMAGDLYLPKNRKPGEKLPAIVFCAGTGGTRKGLPTRLGPILARNGFICLGFDYRGWGESESEILVLEKLTEPDADGAVTVKAKPIRWQMNLMDQTYDIRAAISFLQGEPDVDAKRIGLFGSSYGGGLVTLMAAIDPRVKCAAAQVSGLGIGPQTDKAGFALLTQQARGEIEPVPMETGKLGGRMERYENMRRNPARNVGFGEKFEVVGRIRVPMIFVDAEKEELSNPKENGEKFAAILKENGVPVEYHVIKGITHYGIYREGFEEATKLELAFFRKHLQQNTDKKSSPAVISADKPTPEQSAKIEKPVDRPAEKPVAPAGPMARTARRADPETAFRFLDADKDGLLTRTEVEKLKESVAIFRDNAAALDQFFKRLDEDENGTLTLDEYRKVATIQRQQPAAEPRQKPKPDAPRRPASEEPEEKSKPSDESTQLKPDAVSTTTQIAHFEKKIRPVLVAQCYACHSADAEEIKGGLALDTRDGIRKGGDSGPAVVPGDFKASLLIAAIRHEDGLEMPPKGKLTEEQIADFVTWISTGAVDPREGIAAKSSSAIDLEEGRRFWAFQRPVKPPLPPIQNEKWPLTEVDRFIMAAQEKNGLSVVADAEPLTLIRRLYFDLIGLPPTPEEVRAFVSDWQTSPQQTLESTVDRLLNSTHFGERWGRHWLDVARYAESSGKETSFSYPQAWRYRDYVIDSFNADVPFDQFIREQIAGDLLPSNNDDQQAKQMIATGFLAIGPKSHIERNKKQFELDLADEQIDAVSQAFLGLTVACARCHDHKFDPIPQADYYALAGIFRSTETLYGTIPVIQNNNPSELLALGSTAGMSAGVPPLSDTERMRLDKQIRDLRDKRAELAKNKQFASLQFVQNGILLNTLEARLKAYEADGTPKVMAMGVRDRKSAKDSELYIRGDVDKPGAKVPRGFVQVLCDADSRLSLRESTSFHRAKGDDSGSGRLELANWIASPENALTSRVFVNRVWLHLFGRGLVATPDNFGASGQTPSHPELLDHLAVTFVEDAWSVKKLIRRIVLSRVYRLDATFVEANFEKDPENVWLWRMSPRRLDAEAIRDAMLATAGQLDLKPPVGSVVAAGGEGYTGGIERGSQLAEQRFNCRSVYLPTIRGRVFESLAEFDGVDGSVVTGQRSETTVPSQSLYLLNSPYVLGLAKNAAQRLMKEASEPGPRIDLAYQRWFGRTATEAELTLAIAFLENYRQKAANEGRASGGPEVAAWTAFCQSLWASGEFLVRK
jgi:acetyl esterase/lipase/cytochrome c553/mono/diheme cytochrome c family protein